MRLGIVAYIVPFLFVFQPALIAKGSAAEIVTACLTASAGVILLSIACVGYLFQPMSWPKRLWAIAAGACFMLPPGTGVAPAAADAVGLTLGIALLLWEHRHRAAPAARTDIRLA
jgi:TRAP-type uncharacterized transport system fused permease subunit